MSVSGGLQRRDAYIGLGIGSTRKFCGGGKDKRYGVVWSSIGGWYTTTYTSQSSQDSGTECLGLTARFAVWPWLPVLCGSHAFCGRFGFPLGRLLAAAVVSERELLSE